MEELVIIDLLINCLQDRKEAIVAGNKVDNFFDVFDEISKDLKKDNPQDFLKIYNNFQETIKEERSTAILRVYNNLKKKHKEKKMMPKIIAFLSYKFCTETEKIKKIIGYESN